MPPTFSIGARNSWAFGVLEEAGYAYSSSVNPIRHDLYGMPDAPRVAVPPGRRRAVGNSDDHACGRSAATGRAPAAAIFACCRMACFVSGLALVNRRERRPGIFYFHPWEIDPGQPRVAGCGWKSRFRHYTNLSRMAGGSIGCCAISPGTGWTACLPICWTPRRARVRDAGIAALPLPA